MKRIIFLASLFMMLAAIPANARRTQAEADNLAREARVAEVRDSLNAILAKANDGDAAAQNEVGLWYYTGRHVTRNYATAYEWWAKSARQNNVRAIANLGLCYQTGNGIARDSVDAMRLYMQSIRLGNQALLNQRSQSAQNSAFDAMLVGSCYENGIGCTRNATKAADYFAMAAARGSVDGMSHAGRAYLSANESAKALRNFEAGAAAGDLSCAYWAGKMLLGEMGVPTNKQKAVVYILKAAEGGMPAAEALMGELYATGNGVTRSDEQAAQWYEKAARNGSPEGMWAYGMALRDGIGCQQNYEQALQWLAEAACNGYKQQWISMYNSMPADAPFRLYLKGMRAYMIDSDIATANEAFKALERAKHDEGKIMQAVILSSRKNLQPDGKKAAKILNKLAEENGEAAFYLAALYESGNGVDRDNATALNLYTLAANQGYGKAQSYLGDIYYEGRGYAKDLDKAVDLYLRAERNHQLSKNGALRLAECYDNSLGGLFPDAARAAALRDHTDNTFVATALSDLPR